VIAEAPERGRHSALAIGLSPVPEMAERLTQGGDACSSDDEDEKSQSVLGSHMESPLWSPRVANRRIDAKRLMELKPQQIPNFRRKAAASANGSQCSNSISKDTDSTAEHSYKRRSNAVGPSKVDTLATLSGIASGKYPSRPSRLMHMSGRNVYHSTSW